MVSDCNLLDVALSGYPFTWGSGRLASNLVEENLVAPISDHNPIVLNTSPKFAAQRCKPFRFENKWLEEADVGECWNGFRDFELLLRLKARGDVLGDWGRHIATAWANNKKELEEEICLLQSASNMASLDRLTQAKKELATLLIKEELYWKQRTNVLWLNGRGGTLIQGFSIRLHRQGRRGEK